MPTTSLAFGTAAVHLYSVDGLVISSFALVATVTRIAEVATGALKFQKQVNAPKHLPKGGNARRVRIRRLGLDLFLLKFVRDHTLKLTSSQKTKKMFDTLTIARMIIRKLADRRIPIVFRERTFEAIPKSVNRLVGSEFDTELFVQILTIRNR
jgi:hypothetical protein